MRLVSRVGRVQGCLLSSVLSFAPLTFTQERSKTSGYQEAQRSLQKQSDQTAFIQENPELVWSLLQNRWLV